MQGSSPQLDPRFLLPSQNYQASPANQKMAIVGQTNPQTGYIHNLIKRSNSSEAV